MSNTEVSTEQEYHAAVKRVFQLMELDPAHDTPEGEELARLAAAVERYEDERYPMTCCSFAARDATARLLVLLRSLGPLYDLAGAIQWVESAQPLLDGQRPVDMLISEKGATEVCAVIAKLRDGVHG